MPLAALSMLSSPTGAAAGGAKLPSLDSKSGASASLDSSGSTYNLTSGTPGDLIVGGSKNNMLLIVAALGLVAFMILRK